MSGCHETGLLPAGTGSASRKLHSFFWSWSTNDASVDCLEFLQCACSVQAGVRSQWDVISLFVAITSFVLMIILSSDSVQDRIAYADTDPAKEPHSVSSVRVHWT